MTYSFGTRSLINLRGIHPDLRRVVDRALALTTQDFGIAGKAVRTAVEQHALFVEGRSQADGFAHKSNHQVHSNGLGYAVDLTPFIAGSFDVDNEAAQYPLALAMSLASADLHIPIVWGGNWMEPLTGNTIAALQANVARYRRTHRGSDFIDLPHFQL